MLLALALIPGLPKFAFLAVAPLLGAAAYAIASRDGRRPRRGRAGAAAADDAPDG